MDFVEFIKKALFWILLIAFFVFGMYCLSDLYERDRMLFYINIEKDVDDKRILTIETIPNWFESFYKKPEILKFSGRHLFWTALPDRGPVNSHMKGILFSMYSKLNKEEEW